MDPNLSLSRDLGWLAATATTIPAAKSMGNNGTTVAVVPTSAVDGASEANNTSYLLLYDTPAGDPGVTLVKKNVSQTSWPQTPNCLDIHPVL
jgi:hypothetical protein